MLIGRLSDNAKFKDEDNISFKALAEFYPNDKALKHLVEDFVTACEPVKVKRHKTVAHTDKKVRLTTYENSIPQLTKSDIDAILKKAQDIINHVSWVNAEQNYGFGFEGDGGAGALIHWLRKGLDNRLPRIE